MDLWGNFWKDVYRDYKRKKRKEMKKKLSEIYKEPDGYRVKIVKVKLEDKVIFKMLKY